MIVDENNNLVVSNFYLNHYMFWSVLLLNVCPIFGYHFAMVDYVKFDGFHVIG
jgi:hypothetical protein